MALERLDPRHFRGMYVLDHYGRYCLATQFVAGRRVLDVACGFGYGTHLLKEAGASQVVGVDLSEKAIEYARAHYSDPKIEYVLGDSHELDKVVAGPFDVVVSFETIEHLREPERFISACRSVVHDRSVLLFSVPNEAHAPPDNPFHLHHFDKPAFEALLRSEFQTRLLLPYYFSLAAVLGEPAYGQVGPLHTAQASLARVDETLPTPDGYVAICRMDGNEVCVRSLLIHSRRSFTEAAEDLHDLEEQRESWMATAEKKSSEAASWRTLANEREQVLAEQERACEWQQAEQLKLRKTNESLRVAAERSQEFEAQSKELDAQLDRAHERIDYAEQRLEVAHQTIAAMEATITWRLGLLMRKFFPMNTRRGRAIRSLWRALLRPLRRDRK